jgi:hypothetical protein
MNDVLTIVMSRNGQPIWLARKEMDPKLTRRMTQDELKEIADMTHAGIDGILQSTIQSVSKPLPDAKKKR